MLEWHSRQNVPLLELLDALDTALRVGNHLPKQVGEAGLADLGRLGPVERSVVDGLAAAGLSQPGFLARGRQIGLRVGHGGEGSVEMGVDIDQCGLYLVRKLTRRISLRVRAGRENESSRGRSAAV